MYKDIDHFVQNCHICQRSRTSHHAPYGILRLLLIPQRVWQDISMDFVTGFPWSKGKNAILVVVCRLMKMCYLILCWDTIMAEELAHLYTKYVARIHGLPQSIVSDRGSVFTSRFWRALCALWKVQI